MKDSMLDGRSWEWQQGVIQEKNVCEAGIWARKDLVSYGLREIGRLCSAKEPRDFCVSLVRIKEKTLAPQSSTLAWKIPWTEEAAVHGVIRTQTPLSDFTFTFHFHALEKEMATHSSVLAWRIPGTVEPSGLPSMGLHRVGHDWSDLAAAAAAAVGILELGGFLKKEAGDYRKTFWHTCFSLSPSSPSSTLPEVHAVSTKAQTAVKMCIRGPDYLTL